MKKFLVKIELKELNEDDVFHSEPLSKDSDLWFKLYTKKGVAFNFFKTEKGNPLEVLPKIIGESFSILNEAIEENSIEGNQCRTKIS